MPFPDSEYPSVMRGKDKRDSQRLLAAAPEMLEVLRYLRDDLKSLAIFDAGNIENYLAGIESVIAKVEGEVSDGNGHEHGHDHADGDAVQGVP